MSALNSSIDDHDGRPKAGLQLVPPVAVVWFPGAVNDVEHAGFRRLRVGIEPRGRGEVKPGGGHQVRVLQQFIDVAEHCVGERTVVEVVRELFCPAAIVLLTWATWPCSALGLNTDKSKEEILI